MTGPVAAGERARRSFSPARSLGGRVDLAPTKCSPRCGADRARGKHAVKTLTGDGDRAPPCAGPTSRSTTGCGARRAGADRGRGAARVVLVGHSYGGMVITGAADALLAQGRRERAEAPGLDVARDEVPLPGERLARPGPKCAGNRCRRAWQCPAHAKANGNALPPPRPRRFRPSTAKDRRLAAAAAGAASLRHVPRCASPSTASDPRCWPSACRTCCSTAAHWPADRRCRSLRCRRRSVREQPLARAYDATGHLAERGHAPAARLALRMWRFGPLLYGERFDAAPPVIARWIALAQAPAPGAAAAQP